jgi:nucleoprotein TPR
MKEMAFSDPANQNDLMIVPKVPTGVSGTALAASLLRDGWSVCPISSILFNLCIYVSNIT